MSGNRLTWVLVIVLLVLIGLALNFLDFQIAQSTTQVSHDLGTARAGEALPGNMAPGQRLYFVVRGEDAVAQALRVALEEALEQTRAIGEATDVSGLQTEQRAPLLLVEPAPQRLWMPVYGEATVTVQVYFAYDGDAPWPLSQPMVLEESPAVMASGEFVLTDTSWGLLSKPAYTRHLAQALAEAIAAALEADVY